MAETNDDPPAATGDDPVVDTGKTSVAKTAKPPVAETRKAFVAETRKVPVAETRKAFVADTRQDHRVAVDLENPQKLGNGGVEAAASAARCFIGSSQLFASEATDYSKKCLESGSAFVGKLPGAKSLESAVQIRATMRSPLTRSSWHIL